MRTMVARLMPKASSPISASPDSFNKIRLCAGRASDMNGLLVLDGVSVPASLGFRRGFGKDQAPALAAATCAATSAAKSSTFFSMPSPTT